MNIYVLRHLQTPYNQTGTISGRSLNLPISTASPIYHTAFLMPYFVPLHFVAFKLLNCFRHLRP